MATFDLAIAQSLYASNDRFPVDFDDAWKWLGYSKKANALRNLMTVSFDEGTDFTVAHLGANCTLDVSAFESAKMADKYYLTVDCFKGLGMMAKTEQGKQIRRYFIECEKSHKESAQTIELLRSQLSDLQSKLDAAMSAKVSQFVGRSGMEREIQAIRCEMEQIKATIGMEYPVEAKAIRDGMVKRMVAIVKKATRKLPPTFVSPGQLDLELPTALSSSTRSKANGGN